MWAGQAKNDAEVDGRPGTGNLTWPETPKTRPFKPFFQGLENLAYEDLIDGAALQGLGDYLGLEIAEEADVDRDYSRVARSKNYGEWRSWLTLADQAWVCENWGEHLRSLGYSLEMVEEAPAINPELSLDYIAQFQPPNP